MFKEDNDCKLEYVSFSNKHPKGKHDSWYCTKCGELPWKDLKGANYCPRCGRKNILVS